jgi:hypothetical protein
MWSPLGLAVVAIGLFSGLYYRFSPLHALRAQANEANILGGIYINVYEDGTALRTAAVGRVHDKDNDWSKDNEELKELLEQLQERRRVLDARAAHVPNKEGMAVAAPQLDISFKWTDMRSEESMFADEQ